MPDGWERLAREDALFHIDPTLATGTIDEFRLTGVGLVDWALEWAGPLPRRERALEIGFGVGRNVVHLARHFERVDGVDISPTMVALAEEHGVPQNVRLHATDGRDLRLFEDGAFDLVFSNLVLQHVAEERVVAAYLGEIGRVLAPAGVAVIQLDTRRLGLAARALRALPDPLLPRSRRRHMRRVPRDPDWVRRTIAAAGLRVDAEQDPASALHWLRLRNGV
ncbi:MAG: class I SAM-dependent methyltransferase [Solirubrobacteraceae bacterium]